MRDVAARIDAAPASIDGILGLKGVIEVIDQDESEEERAAAQAAIVEGFAQALRSLSEMRRREGTALGAVLRARLDEIARLTARAKAAPGRKAEAIKARIAEQIATLLETGSRFDPDRLHQEALLIASKADSAIERAVASGEPAHVAKYAFQLSQAFNNFYHEYPVIHEENRERRTFLLWMCDYFRRQLERTLDVLGIEVPAYM